MQDRRNVNKRELKGYRRVLRNNLTSAEAALWKCLKAGGLNGTKWRRQFSVGSYILDFYCPLYKLGIELDGSYHYTMCGDVRDLDRDEVLALVEYVYCGLRIRKFGIILNAYWRQYPWR